MTERIRKRLQSIIVAYSNPEDAKKIRSILVRNGMPVLSACLSGAQVLSRTGSLEEGIIVCGYHLRDMIYRDLADNLPPGFQMLLITSSSRISGETMPDNVVFLSTPLKVSEMLQSLQLMMGDLRVRRKKKNGKPAQRNEKEKQLIEQAKAILMERNHMTEPEAHRYLQKCAMDSGTKVSETAEMILLLASPG